MSHIPLLFFLLLPFNLFPWNLSEMSVEEKVGQLFMVYFEGERANENSLKLLQEAKVGGIVLYKWANKLEGPVEVQKLCFELQEDAMRYLGIPLFIAVDQEGGLVNRLQEGFTKFPSNQRLAESNNPKLAFEAAFAMGKELLSVGVNFNLAPVIDVNSNPKNPVIGTRSYSSDPKVVTEFGRESLEGYKRAGIISCLKHFPGHGDVTVDSHQALPYVSKSLPELLTVELYPFLHLVKEAKAIMTAHILFSEIDPVNPATLSKTILEDLLRKQLGFEGVIITDSLVMQGVLQGHKNLEEVVFKAIEAGSDILLIGGRGLQNTVDREAHVDEIVAICRSIVSAVKEGRITEERIDASLERILELKRELIFSIKIK
jgi:beta-N-acetylhexosaminidase